MDSEQRIRDMKAYYADRMTRYDPKEGDAPPGWVSDELLAYVRAALAGRRVLEVACGTGLWSGWLAQSVGSLLSTEYNETALALARSKSYPHGKVEFRQADAYALESLPGGFDGGFHCDWWSHVPKSSRAKFLQSFHSRLAPRATVVMVDHQYWPNKKEMTDAEGNLIQRRKFADGREAEVVKNFPDEAELRADILPLASAFEYRVFAHCGVHGSGRWCVRYTRK